MPQILSREGRSIYRAHRLLPATAFCLFSTVAISFYAPLSVQAATSAPENQRIALRTVTEPVASLSLDVALQLALSANADLSAARQEVAAVDASVIQAGVRPNPDVSASIEDLQKKTRTSTVQLNQILELGGKRTARVKAAELGRDAALADLAVKRAEIRAGVITAFFDVVIAQERLRLAQSSIELAQRATTAAAHRVTAGKVSPVEETKARVAEANVRLEFNQAKSELANARKRLSAIWGNPSPRFERADADLTELPALPPQSDLPARLANAPSLARARIEVDRRRALAQVESSRRTPNVIVSVGIKRAEDLGRNQAVLGISVPLPFFDRNQGNLLEALRRTDKARDQLSAVESRLDSDVAQAYERLATARQAVESLQRDILPGAQSAYDAATKGFAFGKFSFLDVLDAQRTLLQAKTQYLRALSDIHHAAAEIDLLLGDVSPVAHTVKP